jgi:hypothetical protein
MKLNCPGGEGKCAGFGCAFGGVRDETCDL